MTDEKKTLKFQMMMSPAEADTLDNWMFENRMRSRAEAIRRLCQIALALEPLIEQTYSLAGDVIKYRFKSWDKLTDILDEIRFPEPAPGQQVQSEDVVRAIGELSSDWLSPQSETELFLAAATMREIFNGIKSGEKIEDSVARAKEEIAKIPRMMDISPREPKS